MNCSARLRPSNRILLGKIESTYVTYPAPSGTEPAILVSTMRRRHQDSVLVSRNLIRPYFGNSEQIPVAIRASVGFECELASARCRRYRASLRAAAACLRQCTATNSLRSPVRPTPLPWRTSKQ